MSAFYHALAVVERTHSLSGRTNISREPAALEPFAPLQYAHARQVLSKVVGP